MGGAWCCSAVLCCWGRVSPAWRVRHLCTACSCPLLEGSQGVPARRGVDSPPELLRNSYGNKSLPEQSVLRSRLPWVWCVVLIALGLRVTGGGQRSPVLCIKAVVLMRSELLSWLRLGIRSLWPCPGNKTLFPQS